MNLAVGHQAFLTSSFFGQIIDQVCRTVFFQIISDRLAFSSLKCLDQKTAVRHSWDGFKVLQVANVVNLSPANICLQPLLRLLHNFQRFF